MRLIWFCDLGADAVSDQRGCRIKFVRHVEYMLTLPLHEEELMV